MADVKAFFKKVFPFLSVAATVAGGPVGAAGAAILGKVLGEEVKPEAIGDVIAKAAMSEEGRLKLAQAEQQFALEMETLGFKHVEELERIATADRDSARKREMTVKDKMPMALGILAVAALIFCICLIAFVEMPSGAKEAILTLIGFVGASYKDVYGYYFGSSAGSEAKNQLLADNGK